MKCAECKESEQRGQGRGREGKGEGKNRAYREGTSKTVNLTLASLACFSPKDKNKHHFIWSNKILPNCNSHQQTFFIHLSNNYLYQALDKSAGDIAINQSQTSLPSCLSDHCSYSGKSQNFEQTRQTLL